MEKIKQLLYLTLPYLAIFILYLVNQKDLLYDSGISDLSSKYILVYSSQIIYCGSLLIWQFRINKLTPKFKFTCNMINVIVFFSFILLIYIFHDYNLLNYYMNNSLAFLLWISFMLYNCVTNFMLWKR